MTKPESISSLDAHAGYWLRWVSNHVSHAFKLKVEAHGVTVAEWVVLRQLFDAGETHPSQLAENLGMTRGAISKLVDRLVAKGHVVRTAGEDDRRPLLHGRDHRDAAAEMAQDVPEVGRIDRRRCGLGPTRRF